MPTPICRKTCVAVRKDGKAVDIDGDYTETLARLDSNKTGIGVFGLSFYEQNNADKLKVATVGGIVPSTETIAVGRVPGLPPAVLLRQEGRTSASSRASRNMSSSSSPTT